MGVRNFLVEGLSGTGKTTVADELERRGHHAVHGDRELAYQGDAATGEPTDGDGTRTTSGTSRRSGHSSRTRRSR